MNLDGPSKPGSLPMDIDDGTHHPHRCDSVNLPGPSGEQTPFVFHPQNPQFAGSVQTSIPSLPSQPLPDCECLPGLDDSPQPMILASPSSPMHHVGEMPSSLKPSVQDVTTRKRKHTHDLPDYDHDPHDDTFTDGANSQSRRRTRPRLQTQRDREFTPLLIMSPGREPVFLVEETITAFHYPSNLTDPSHSIQRHFLLENLTEHRPRILRSSSLPKVDDPEERSRSDSATSFAEVALASTVARKHGRLSTLEDIWLPRPFEDAERPSLGSIKVHERGLDALPSFRSTSGGRMGGLRASRAEPAGSPTDTLGHPIRPTSREHGTHAVSPRSAMLPLETGTTKFFDKPLCDSPEEIDPDEKGRPHFELPRPSW
ncbi:hypothetical protein OG21DRAFT_1493311 [Imleria badia]|nr:hypothetical protein OG21DRAFT_1493311 [Imleria badia]